MHEKRCEKCEYFRRNKECTPFDYNSMGTCVNPKLSLDNNNNKNGIYIGCSDRYGMCLYVGEDFYCKHYLSKKRIKEIRHNFKQTI